MVQIALIDALPDAATYNRLRAAVGWGGYEPAAIEAWLPRSLYGVLAQVDGRTVGMARVVGDGGLVFYIQDVIVEPAYQGQGIGSAMMERVMGYIADHAHPGSIVGLMAAKGREPFYERYGFWARPTERYGPGMIIFWDANTSRVSEDLAGL